MDLILEQFSRHGIAVDVLDLYNNKFKKVIRDIVRIVPITSGGDDKDDLMFVSGSNVEGSNLARLFNADYGGINREVEFDLMFRLMQVPPVLHTKISLEFVEGNQSFFHIFLRGAPPDVDAQYESMGCGGFSTGNLRHQVFIPREYPEGCYLSTAVFKSAVESIERTMYGDRFAGANGIVTFDSNPRGAATGLHIRYRSDAVKVYDRKQPTRDNHACNLTPPGEELLHQQSIAIIVERLNTYYGEFREILLRLKTMEDEFRTLRMCGKELMVEQVRKAKEWLQYVIHVNDYLCNARAQTTGWIVKTVGGFDFSSFIEENIRKPVRNVFSELEIKLAFPDNQHLSQDNFDTAEAVLIDIEIVRMSKVMIFCRASIDQVIDGVKAMQMTSIPPSEASLRLRMFGEQVDNLKFDLVPSIHFSTWPEVAKEWIDRPRAWPDKGDVDNIVQKGFFAVCKSFCHDDIDWRLSFSVAETDIANLWSPWQHFFYFVFKSLFYRFIKPLSSETHEAAACSGSTFDQPSKETDPQSKKLTSYLLKTVMMRVSEDFPQSWWNEDNASDCLTVLVMTFLSSVESRRLPHYFIDSLNLLEDIPDATVTAVVSLLNRLMAEPAEFAAQLEPCFEHVLLFLKAIDDQVETSSYSSEASELLEKVNRLFDGNFYLQQAQSYEEPWILD